MKILHTGDWHIGKKVNGFSMLENQEMVFNQIYDIIKDEKIDVVIVAGDLYDKSIPDVDSVKFLNEVLINIVKRCKVKIILISGNHDSVDRNSFAKDFLESSGIYMCGKFEGDVRKIILEDEFGKVNFYPISYFDEVFIRYLYKDDTIKTSDDALKKIINEFNIDYSERNIFIGHGYFSNKNGEKMLESDSERRLSIGGQEVMDVTILENFDYVALGHLHLAQKVVHDYIRYSGSIIKYSFSEIKHKKSVTIVDILEKGKIKIKQIELKSKYDMKEIQGFCSDLINEEVYKNLNVLDYYKVILHDSIGISDPISELRKVYKNVMEVRFKDVLEGNFENEYSINSSDLSSKTTFELFEQFYTSITEKELNDIQKEIISDVIKTSNILDEV